MQDMEFTIERGKLFMLQTRNGKRTAAAALKIAVDLVREGMITKEEAILKVEPKNLDTLLHPNFEQKALKAAVPVAKGLLHRREQLPAKYSSVLTMLLQHSTQERKRSYL